MSEIEHWRDSRIVATFRDGRSGTEIRSSLMELSEHNRFLERAASRHAWRSKARIKRRRYF